VDIRVDDLQGKAIQAVFLPRVGDVLVAEDLG
jgi:hypothetical protein